MTHQPPINAVTGARLVADNTEQIAHYSRRTVVAFASLVDDVKAFHQLASPLIEWLQSRQSHSPAKAPLLVSTSEGGEPTHWEDIPSRSHRSGSRRLQRSE